METRRLIPALFMSLAVFYVVLYFSNKFSPPPAATQPATRPADITAQSPGKDRQSASTTATSAISDQVTTPGVKVIGGEDASPVRLGATQPGNPFPMALDIMPQGAAVSHAAIRDYFDTLERVKPYAVLSPLVVADAAGRDHTFYSFDTPKVRFQNLDIEVELSRVVWAKEPGNDNEAVFSVRVEGADGQPIARIIKRYHLAEQPHVPKASTYDLLLSVEVESLTSQPLEVILTQLGPVGFRKEDPRYEDRRVLGVKWKNGQLYSEGHARTELDPGKGLLLAQDRDEDNERIAWGAEINRYFACIMNPVGRQTREDPPRFATLEALSLMPEVTTREDAFTYRFVSLPIKLSEQNKQAQIAFNCYIGPKSKTILDSITAYRELNYYLVIRDGVPWCTFDALVRVMMYLLDVFHRIPPHNYGIAIIFLVLVVRAILHPITKKSQVNMYKMQKDQATLQPKLQAAREKYANDKAKMQQAVMEVYRDAGINPAGSMLTCLPMFLQLPVWGALWSALASTVEMRHAPFDGWWIKDLSSPDSILYFRPVHIPLIEGLMGGPVEALNILPVLLAISQLLQMKYMPHHRPTAAQQNDQATAQMEQQRKMMMIMSPLFMLMLYNAPSGLNLYIMSSNFFGLFEQWRIRKHLAEVEARQQAEERLYGPKSARPRKRSWLMQKWDQLAKEAEEARRIQSSKKGRAK